MKDMESITWRTRISLKIMLWLAEKFWDGQYSHHITEITKDIKAELDGHK